MRDTPLPKLPDDHPAYAIADAAIAQFMIACEAAALMGIRTNTRQWMRDAIAQAAHEHAPATQYQEMRA